MKLIIGLGNPGKKYEHTRHNAGFRVAGALAAELGLKFKFNEKINADIAVGDGVIIAKPRTFMNNSGEAAGKMNREYRMENSDILVMRDEIDLPFGKIKFGAGGSAGHHGDESITEAVGPGFNKLRIGIENRKQHRIPDTETYVLENFTAAEEQELKEKIIPEAVMEIKKIFPSS